MWRASLTTDRAVFVDVASNVPRFTFILVSKVAKHEINDHKRHNRDADMLALVTLLTVASGIITE